MRPSCRALLLVIICTAPLHGDDLYDQPGVADMFRDVLKRGNFGLREEESAAFIALEPDGQYRCIAWPPTAEFHTTRYVGAMPRGVVAIVHTHPQRMPMVSGLDRLTASRLGIPVYAVSRGSIYKALPGGEPRSLVRNNFWYDARSIPKACRLPGHLLPRAPSNIDLIEVCGRRLVLRGDDSGCDW